MNDVRTLHIKRIEEGYQQIAEIRDKKLTAHDVEFSSWKDRVIQSLRHLYGQHHEYSRRFNALLFWSLRATIDSGLTGSYRSGPTWSREDQERFYGDLHLAEQILADALEELNITPKMEEKLPTDTKNTQTIVINVHNILSQTTSVQLSQIISNLNNLELSDKDRILVEKHATELSDEAHGEQRWPVLAKSLDALKSFGKSVYEQVAIPLLLEMLKKQTGLND